jgi:hypothetical protein
MQDLHLPHCYITYFPSYYLFFYQVKLIGDMLQQYLTLKCSFEDILPFVSIDICVSKALRCIAQLE